MRFCVALWIALAVACVGCSGGGTPGSSFDPLAYCENVVAPALVYPSPAASAIADGNFALTVAYSHNPGNAFTPPILLGGPLTIGGNAWAAASAGEWNSLIPPLAANTTYLVTMNDLVCNRTFTLGFFKTQ